MEATFRNPGAARAEERKAKARADQRRFIFEPVGMDRFDFRKRAEPGQVVVKVQPHGCPKNGTMGHCYVADAGTGDFLGLVLVKSLRRLTAAEQRAMGL